jgi:hypothetical protein
MRINQLLQCFFDLLLFKLGLETFKNFWKLILYLLKMVRGNRQNVILRISKLLKSENDVS